MIEISFDEERLRAIIREEVQAVVRDLVMPPELPPYLTVTQLMELLHIGRWKASELLGRSDFPVLREAGVLIPRDKLFEWIDRNLDWVEDNTRPPNK